MAIKILGVKIDQVDNLQVMRLIEQFLHDGKKHQIVTVNPEFLVKACEDEDFKSILNRADLSLADGTGVVFASIFLNAKIVKRIPGADFLLQLAKFCSEKGYKMFLLGGKPLWVSRKTAETLKKLFPNLLVDSHPGSENIESEKERRQILKAINKFSPDFLFVAYGAPYQEKWLYTNLPLLNVKIALGVGGAFNYLIGRSIRAPHILRKLGLEWLWRLVTDPRYRWRRIVDAVVVFPLLILKEKLDIRRKKRI